MKVGWQGYQEKLNDGDDDDGDVETAVMNGSKCLAEIRVKGSKKRVIVG